MDIWSIYTTAQWGCSTPSIKFIDLWNNAPEVFIPMGKNFHWNNPLWEVNAVISLESTIISSDGAPLWGLRLKTLMIHLLPLADLQLNALDIIVNDVFIDNLKINSYLMWSFCLLNTYCGRRVRANWIFNEVSTFQFVKFHLNCFFLCRLTPCRVTLSRGAVTYII